MKNTRERKVIIMLLLIILNTTFFVSGLEQLQINEIHFNPEGSDNNKEFVEIKGANNLSGYIIGDEKQNDTLELLKFVSGDYSLVVEEGYSYEELNCSVYSAGSTIGDNLNNNEDTIYLYLNETLVDNYTYNSENVSSGHSLEKVNGLFIESIKVGGSPCKENGVKETELEIVENYNIQLSKNNTILEITSLYGGLSLNFSYNISWNESSESEILLLELEENNTINITFTPEVVSEYTFCYTIDNVSECFGLQLVEEELCLNSVTVSPEKEKGGIQRTISFDAYAGIENVLLSYYYYDSFGELLKEGTSTNTNNKKYTPKALNHPQIIEVYASLSGSNCKNNNVSVNMLVLPEESLERSVFEIKEVKKEKYGFFVELEIKRYNTTKQVVELYLADSESYVTKLKIKDDNLHTISLPLFVKECENKEYEIILEGLNEKVSKFDELVDCEEDNGSDGPDDSGGEEKEELTLLEYFIEGRKITATVQVHNKFEEEKDYTLHSYIYNKSKSYSGERTANEIEFELESKEDKEINLVNVLNGDSGEYKFKIKLFRTGRTTPIELTEEVSFGDLENLEDESERLKIEEAINVVETPTQLKRKESNSTNNHTSSPSSITGAVVKTDQESKAKTYIFPLLLALLVSIPGIYNGFKQRNKEKNRRGLDKSNNSVRSSRQPKRTRRKLTETIH